MVSDDFDLELFNEFVAEALESLESLDSLFVTLESDPDIEVVDKIFRAVHTVKGNCSVFGFEHIKEFTHEFENLLDRIRQQKVSINSNIVDLLLNGKDLLYNLIENQRDNLELNVLSEDEKSLLEVVREVKNDKDDSSDIQKKLSEFIDRWSASCEEGHPALDLLVELQEIYDQFFVKEEEVQSTSGTGEEFDYIFDEDWQDDEAPEKIPEVPEMASAKSEKKVEEPKKEEKTAGKDRAMPTVIRVEQETVDGFLKDVGELITLGEGFKFLGNRINSERINADLRKDFQNTIMAFTQLSLRLQKSVLDIRKVSVNTLLKKIPRMVRSLASNLDKKVNLVIEGEDTTLDKFLIDVLEDPLIHFIRNSMDHGIEMPEARREKGKDETGTLTVSAQADDKDFFLIISDDGNGIDPEKMKKAAVSKGLMTEEEAAGLSEQEAQEIVFLPGFSTAEVVTDVSGRGVGMDVVMTNINKAKGKISLSSTPGKGATFTIQLPLIGTTVVIQSLQFQVGDVNFVAPLEFVREVVVPEKGSINTVQDRDEIFSFREQMIPVTYLSRFFDIGLEGEKANRKDNLGILVIIEHDKSLNALMVDKICGIQQVVLKEISEKFEKNPAVSGTALMGDGSVAIVVDCKNLSKNLSLSH
jgi:two-component system chemotaxis sensor kinase CheA